MSLFTEDGKIKKIDNIDQNLIEALSEVFMNDIRNITSEKELFKKQGSQDVIDFLISQQKLMEG